MRDDGVAGSRLFARNGLSRAGLYHTVTEPSFALAGNASYLNVLAPDPAPRFY